MITTAVYGYLYATEVVSDYGTFILTMIFDWIIARNLSSTIINKTCECKQGATKHE